MDPKMQATSQDAPLLGPERSESGDTTLYLSAAPAVIKQNVKYALKLEKVEATGIFTFSFINPEKEAKHKKFVDYYLNHSCLEDLQMDPADIYPKVMTMVISPDRKEIFRGQVYSVEDGFIGVYDVDRSRFFHCPKDWFYLIGEDYLMEPLESFSCVLDDVEFFNGSKSFRHALEELHSILVGTELEGEYTGTSKFNYWLPKFRIHRHDADDPYGLDFNSAITVKVYENCAGSLPEYRSKEEKLASPVGIGDDGAIYIQFDDSFAERMESFLGSLPARFPELSRPRKSVRIEDLSKTTVYVAPVGGIMFRVKIMGHIQPEKSSEGVKVKMFKMDYGNTCSVLLNTLIPADSIHIHLAQLPPLCHKVYLHWIRGFIDKERVLDEIGGQKYAVKIKRAKRDGIPVAVLSEKNPNDGHDTTVNQRLVRMKLASRALDVTVAKPAQSSAASHTSSRSNATSSLC